MLLKYLLLKKKKSLSQFKPLLVDPWGGRIFTTLRVKNQPVIYPARGALNNIFLKKERKEKKIKEKKRKEKKRNKKMKEKEKKKEGKKEEKKENTKNMPKI